MKKPHLEFRRVDLEAGWQAMAGDRSDIRQKVPAGDLDGTAKMCCRTRLLRLAPGAFATARFVHDHREEAYLLDGDPIVGNDENGQGGEPFEAPTCACRPLGAPHGPFKSGRGCMLYEIHYDDESGR